MPRKSSPTKRPAASASRGRAAAASSVAATPLPTLFRVRKPSLPRRNVSNNTKLSDSARSLAPSKKPVTSTNRRAKIPSQHVSPVPSPSTSASALTTPPKSVTVAQPPTPSPQRAAGLPRQKQLSVRASPFKARKASRVPTPPKVQKKLQFERRKTPARVSQPLPNLPTTPVTGGSLRSRPEEDVDCFGTLAPCTESDDEYDDDVVDVRQDRLISPSSDPLISHVLQLFPPEDK